MVFYSYSHAQNEYNAHTASVVPAEEIEALRQLGRNDVRSSPDAYKYIELAQSLIDKNCEKEKEVQKMLREINSNRSPFVKLILVSSAIPNSYEYRTTSLHRLTVSKENGRKNQLVISLSHWPDANTIAHQGTCWIDL